MNRPWQRWLVFAACLTVLSAAMGWMTATTLRLDRAQRDAARQAEREERARLALWRMDSALTALIVEESARPVASYRPFYEAERAYSKGNVALKQGEVVVPSPLLAFSSSNILLHFQREPNGTLISPQVPAGQQQILAADAQNPNAPRRISQERLAAMDALLRKPSSATNGTAPPVTSSKAVARQWRNDDLLVRESGAVPPMPSLNNEPSVQLAANQPGKFSQQQTLRDNRELQSRATVVQQAAQQAVNNANYWNAPPQPPAQGSVSDPNQAVVFKALWLDNQLVLARRVSPPGGQVVQGIWLNWANLRASLLASIADLFPRADLRPASQPARADSVRRLAALPVELVPGPDPTPAANGWSPLRISLAVAWVGALLAALAAGFLLLGTISLSERRAAFVSAVTHELRTPLTTFRMYSEMLATDMVTDPEKRKGYLATLCSEASRLTHLVENVLAYAQLERGSARQRIERVTLRELIERVQPRLLQRAQQAGATLVSDADPAAAQTTVQVDVSAVEQILFNLVDNSCKYATTDASEKTIHLEALPMEDNGRFAMLRVRDHGQGISAEAARRLFQPFSKSATQAAHSAPGVGLGLALCRRLSRSLGGELRLDSTVHDGACFVLSLPAGAT